MKIKNKLLAKTLIIGLVMIVLTSIIGIMTTIRTHVVLQGQIEATEIRIYGKLSGRVDTFLVDEGQIVARGDTLVRISIPEAWTKLQQSNAMDAVQGTVNEVQSVLQDAWLTAPIYGEIATIYAKQGELVGTETPIMNLVVLDNCHVVLNLHEDYLPNFGMGQAFVGKVPAIGGKEVVFQVNYISPSDSLSTRKSMDYNKGYNMRTFEIHALPMEPVPGLRPGMSVLIKL